MNEGTETARHFNATIEPAGNDGRYYTVTLNGVGLVRVASYDEARDALHAALDDVL